MESNSAPSTPPAARQTTFFDEQHPPLHERLEETDSQVNAADIDSQAVSDNGSSQHIRMESPVRPRLSKRNTLRGMSAKNINEALRLAKSREEQETLLGDHEEADDDGCYPPRRNSEPRAPNPHLALPVYTTIHKIRRLVIASIGGHIRRLPCLDGVSLLIPVHRRSIQSRTIEESTYEPRNCQTSG